MGRKAVVAIAAALIVCPIVFLLGYKHWLDTRTFNPLDIPVSLSQGHFKTPEFYINLKGPYAVNINAPECQPQVRESLRVHFIAYQNGVPIGETDQPGDVGFGALDFGKTGYYSLGVEVLSHADCLNSADARLQVSTWGSYYEDRYDTALWAIPVASIAGLALLGYIVVFLASKARPYRIAQTEGEEVPTGLPGYRPRSVKLISTLPHFPLLLATLLALLVFVGMVLVGILFTPFPAKGLYVSLNVRAADAGTPNSAMPPIVVRLQDVTPSLAGPPLAPKLYVNSVPVEWHGLDDALKNQLKLRAEWVVYVDGDSEVPWQNVAQVADVAKGLHAKVILLTPETRKLVEPEIGRGKPERR